MRAVALTLMLLPSIALAQQPLPPADDPGECTTTTTVRCTGAAAPYAVMPPPPPAAPVVAPPPPPPAAPPQIVVLDPRKLAGDGWKLTQDAQGCLWRERKTSTDSRGCAPRRSSYAGRALTRLVKARQPGWRAA